MPAGEAPPEEALLDLEQAVQRVLDLAAVAQRLPELEWNDGREVADLGADRLRHRLDSVSVHLLEAPQDPVGGREHPVEGVASPVLAPQRRELPENPAAGVIDHRRLPFPAYGLTEVR